MGTLIPKTVSRAINPDHLKRASRVPDDQVGPYLDSIVTSMHIHLDNWRFGKGPSADFELDLNACIALFTEAQLRGLA